MQHKILVRALGGAGAAVLALVAVLGIHTAQLPSRQAAAGDATPPAIDLPAATARLAGVIRIPTVSGAPDAGERFLQFHAYLAQAFPRAHAALEREVVNGHSLLYTWKGRDATRKPILLMAHQDVVPAGTEGWRVPPFAGEVRDGAFWGRGAWDNKSAITAHLEAIELLLAQGFEPEQTILLAYGHDEETHGRNGAMRIASLLQARGVRLDFVVDEGMVVTDGIIRGLPAPRRWWVSRRRATCRWC